MASRLEQWTVTVRSRGAPPQAGGAKRREDSGLPGREPEDGGRSELAVAILRLLTATLRDPPPPSLIRRRVLRVSSSRLTRGNPGTVLHVTVTEWTNQCVAPPKWKEVFFPGAMSVLRPGRSVWLGDQLFAREILGNGSFNYLGHTKTVKFRLACTKPAQLLSLHNGHLCYTLKLYYHTCIYNIKISGVTSEWRGSWPRPGGGARAMMLNGIEIMMEPEMCFWVPGEAGGGTGSRSGPPSGVQVEGRITQLGDEVARIRQPDA
eukprot:3087616-Rhodomonas_salina.5